MTIAFDDADIFWLRGYIHVLLGTVNIVLAHDWRDAFERTAHLVFAKPETPYPFLLVEGEQQNWSANQIVDLVAFIHLINFEVVEPKRFDLVLWLQGTGVAAFLERGKTIDLQAWQDLSESFGGRLPFFSFWIN